MTKDVKRKAAGGFETVLIAGFADAARSPSVDRISTDLFDTILLRDASLQRARFSEMARLLAPRVGRPGRVISALRQSMHVVAYRAVSAEGGRGDARLSSICRSMAMALGLEPSAARVIRDAEITADIAHLSANAPLLECLREVSRTGKRVFAVSDTYYAAEDLRRILAEVVGPCPIATIYSSADLGLTKHRGTIFADVVRREGIGGGRILHIGDDWKADVLMPRAAGWSTFHFNRNKRTLKFRKAIAACAAAVTDGLQGPRRSALP